MDTRRGKRAVRRPFDSSPCHLDCLGLAGPGKVSVVGWLGVAGAQRPGTSRSPGRARIVRRMRIPRPRLLILGFALALVMVTTASGCLSSPLRIVSSDKPERSGMEALLRGTLAVDDDGCVYATTAGDQVTLVWPKGYTVEGDAWSFAVLDASKNVVARSGLPLAIGGGGADSFNDTWAERGCAKGR